MTQTPLTENWHDGGFMVSKAEGHRSMDKGVLTGSAKRYPGTVCGKKTLGAASSAAKSGGNTGTGTLVLDVTTPVLVNAIPGVYQVRCIEAVANGGKFQVIDPNGLDLGTVIIPAGAGNSVTFADRIKFVLTDSADFIVGDGFDVTVAVGSGKYLQCDPAALDGSQVASAILYGTADATAVDVNATFVTRSCEVNASELLWKSGMTTDQIAAATAQLAIAGIIAR